MMGDNRVTIKIEFDAHGKVYKTDMNINYFDSGDGVDDRVAEFFRESWEDACFRYRAQVAKHFQKERAAEIERLERAQLADLQAKYGR